MLLALQIFGKNKNNSTNTIWSHLQSHPLDNYYQYQIKKKIYLHHRSKVWGHLGMSL